MHPQSCRTWRWPLLTHDGAAVSGPWVISAAKDAKAPPYFRTPGLCFCSPLVRRLALASVFSWQLQVFVCVSSSLLGFSLYGEFRKIRSCTLTDREPLSLDAPPKVFELCSLARPLPEIRHIPRRGSFRDLWGPWGLTRRAHSQASPPPPCACSLAGRDPRLRESRPSPDCEQKTQGTKGFGTYRRTLLNEAIAAHRERADPTTAPETGETASNLWLSGADGLFEDRQEK